VTLRDRHGLISRIRQIRRAAAAAETRPAATGAEPPASRVEALEVRVGHLERLVEGLQDSVHRESERHGRLIAELHAQTRPGAMSAAITKDARGRGL